MKRLLWLKAWRDLRQNFGAFLACIVIMALAIALLIGLTATYANLGNSTDYAYRRFQFLDASVNLKDSPPTLADTVAQVPGVAAVEARYRQKIRIVLPNQSDYTQGVALGVPALRPLTVNQLHVLSGSALRLPRGEALLEKRYADLHGFRVGDRIRIQKRVGNTRVERQFTLVGLVVSPEWLWVTPDRLDPRPAVRRFGVVFLSHQDMASLTGTSLINELQLRLQSSADPISTLSQVSRLLAGQRQGPVLGREDQPSYALLERDRKGLAGVASVFPVTLLFLSGIMLFLNLWQLIHSQRKQIGLLLCQGLSWAQIGASYLALALLVGLISAISGTLLGPGLAHLATQRYVATLSLPFVVESTPWGVLWLGWGVALALSVLAALASLRRLFSKTPLELLHQEFAAEAGGWLGRLPLRLHLVWMYPLRNLVRQPGRSFVMIGGSLVSLSLLLMTLALYESQRSSTEFLLGQMHRYDVQVDLFASPRAQIPPIEHWPGVYKVERIRREGATLYAGSRRLERGIWGLEQGSSLLRLFDEQLQPLDLPGDALCLSRVQQRQLGVREGDTLQLEIPNWTGQSIRIPIRVGPTVYEPVQGPLKIDVRHLHRLAAKVRFSPPVFNSLLLTCDPNQLAGLRRKLLREPLVESISTLQDLRSDVQELLSLALVYIGLMLSCAALISLALIQACVTMSFNERRREVASLLVQGVRTRQVFALLFRETLLLWLISAGLGILCGFAAGDWLLGHYQPDLLALRLKLGPLAVVGTLAAGFGVTMLASAGAMRDLIRTPLAEATRSPE